MWKCYGSGKKRDIANGQQDKWALKTCQNRIYLNIYTNVKKKIENKRIANMTEIQEFYSAVMRGEIKDQFGIDASLDTRMAAGRELMKRIEKAEANKNDFCGITIINNIPRPEEKDGQ